MKKSIGILITVFNRKEKTLQCLRLIYKQEGLNDYDVDIFIVDGGSNDGTPAAIKAEFPEVHVSIYEGLYWNRGMHAAWKEASSTKDYDLYLWLNDDTNLYPFAIRTLIDASLEHNNSAIIIGPTVDTKTHTIPTYGGRAADGSLLPLDGQPHIAHHFNGNIVLIPNQVFKQVGNLDPYFSHSKGDFDYGLRAAKQGIVSYQLGKAIGECDTHPNLDKWCNPEYSLTERWKAMHLPNGMPPNETFYFERRHLGVLPAIFHWLTIHIRCVFPKIWKKNQA